MEKTISILECNDISFILENELLTISKNQGYVDLSSLTTLPAGIKFENQGDVDLSSLTTLPAGIKFENQGYVYLRSLTTLPSGIIVIDDYGMIVKSKKMVKEFIIYDCNYMGSKKQSYVAKKGIYSAHGDTIKEAIEDVNFKYLQSEFNIEELVYKIKKENSITVNDFRLLTGACRQGCKNFLSQKGITENEFTVKKALSITDGHYGSEKLKELFN